MQTSKLVKISAAVAAALTLVACGKKEEAPAPQAAESAAPAAAEAQVVNIGFAAPLTGPQAHYGEEYKNGVTLAVEDANAENPTIDGKPVKFQLQAEDDQADPKTATQVAQKFVDAKINGIIGHFNSGTAIPASKIYNDAGIPMIAMATAPQFTQQGFNTTFRSMTSDTQQGAVMENSWWKNWARRKSPSLTTAPLTAKVWRMSSRNRLKQPVAKSSNVNSPTTKRLTSLPF